MEATATTSATASRTIADLIPSAAARHGERVAVRYKRDGAWHDVSYTQLAEIVDEVGLGLIDLGIQPGERVCILANTRPEWSYADMGATSTGAIVVPIYQTNSPEECLWVISDSEACAIFVRGRGAARQDRRDPRPDPQRALGHRDRPARRSGRQRRRRRGAGARRDHARAAARARPRTLRRRSSTPAARPCARTTPSPSSTPRAPPARRRGACSPTATTGR